MYLLGIPLWREVGRVGLGRGDCTMMSLKTGPSPPFPIGSSGVFKTGTELFPVGPVCLGPYTLTLIGH